ncbi:MAG: HEAT repeat domain-containing protein, partial [Acidobacteria bacterium]|nr:HEAT repeat domain-containing protein [Acidobacteriota bacterium]MDW7985551.1 HEAT repeat domain-containing protein [Acidobacteriota bacterium]
RIKARHYVRDLRRRFPTSVPPPAPLVPELPRPMPPKASWREALERFPIVDGVDSRLLIERALQEGGEEAVQTLIHFLEDPRWHRREMIVQALRNYPHFPSSYLHPLLHHPLWYVRAAAIELLGAFQDPLLLEHAARLAKDSNIEVRRALVGALRHFRFEEDARLVLEVLARDDHFLIRRLARESLIQLRQISSSMGPEPGLS